MPSREKLHVLGKRLREQLAQHYVYKDNKGRIGNYFLPACGDTTVAIDAVLASTVPGLSQVFFEDIRSFNLSFSRAHGEGMNRHSGGRRRAMKGRQGNGRVEPEQR